MGGIVTYTGKVLDPFDPDPEMIDIVDIAHHLAMESRFSGALVAPYSVAEHSVRVSRLLIGPDALAGLLHDASEAYLRDIPTPVKVRAELSAYRQAEMILQDAIYAKFGCAGWDYERLRRADEAMLHTEARWLFRDVPDWVDRNKIVWASGSVAVGVGWGWKMAEDKFLARFRVLTSHLN